MYMYNFVHAHIHVHAHECTYTSCFKLTGSTVNFAKVASSSTTSDSTGFALKNQVVIKLTISLLKFGLSAIVQPHLAGLWVNGHKTR